jgi:hypothetical protein
VLPAEQAFPPEFKQTSPSRPCFQKRHDVRIECNRRMKFRIVRNSRLVDVEYVRRKSRFYDSDNVTAQIFGLSPCGHSQVEALIDEPEFPDA